MSNYKASARSVNTSGGGSSDDCVNYVNGLRFVVFLGPGTMISSGTGSESDPFIILES